MRSTDTAAPDGARASSGGQFKSPADFLADAYFERAAQVRGTGREGPSPDWRLIRDAEANAREIGLRASVPDPAAAGTPGYAADRAHWGSGRGIGPGSVDAGPESGGPEAGG